MVPQQAQEVVSEMSRALDEEATSLQEQQDTALETCTFQAIYFLGSVKERAGSIHPALLLHCR